MISHAPFDGMYCLKSIWTAIFTHYAHHLIEKDRYAVVFAILERNLRHNNENVNAIHEPDETAFFQEVQCQVRNLLWESTVSNAETSSNLPLHGIAHMLISESLRDDEYRAKYGLHLLHLLMKIEHGELRKTLSTSAELSAKQKWFSGYTSHQWRKECMPMLLDFLTTPSDLLRKLALTPEGSRILQLIWSLLHLQDELSEKFSCQGSRESPNESCRKRISGTEQRYPRLSRFARRFRQYLAKLACDPYGSHFVELFIRDAEDSLELQSIANTLRTKTSMHELRSSLTGRLLIRKFGLERSGKA
mmetsp:Transcript_6637/g.10046  ORF Transcript_6637/g.10046 Transcript_6637/m.10046 type:complete len:304 (-) Transcript_6637:91-1002(-)